MTLRIISGAGLVPVESPTDGPTVDLSQDPDVITNGFGVRLRRQDEPIQTQADWTALQQAANELRARLDELGMNGAERLDRMRDLGRSDFEQGHPQRTPDELLALFPTPGLSALATQLAKEQLWGRYEFHYALRDRYRQRLIDTVVRLQSAASLPQDAGEFEAFMWAPYREQIISRSERAIWRSAPHYCRDAQALHDASMLLAGYDVTGRDAWVRDCVEWAVLPHLRKNAPPPAAMDTAGS